MKTPFEAWLDNQHLSQLPRSLFRESVLCYKAGAYRASMIMSFLGLQNIVRERILQAAKPTNVDLNKWNTYLSHLRNDDKWDEATMNVVQGKGLDNTIFNLSDDIRGQYMFWKYRRNDAAHTKNNEITQSHIEVLWSFIKSNLSKLVVIDSDQELINKLKDHFDINKTPVNKPYAYLIEEIPSSINASSCATFFINLDQALQTNRFARSQRASFWNQVLNLREDIAAEASNFIKSDTDLVVGVLILNHDKARLFTDPKFIRELWQQYILVRYNKSEFLLFFYLINNIIPPEEAFEARGNLLNGLLRGLESYPNLIDEQELILELNKGVYKERIYELVLDKMDYVEPGTYLFWGNQNPSVVVFYIKTFGLSEGISQKLYQTFSKGKYPYSLSYSMKALFREKGELYELFKEHLIKNLLEIPRNLSIAPLAPVPPPLLLSPPLLPETPSHADA